MWSEVDQHCGSILRTELVCEEGHEQLRCMNLHEGVEMNAGGRRRRSLCDGAVNVVSRITECVVLLLHLESDATYMLPCDRLPPVD